MAGRIKYLIDSIIEQRAKGDPAIINTTKTKLLIKGINPDKYTPQSDDDPVVISKLEGIAKEFGLSI
jgi:hypothetical protein